MWNKIMAVNSFVVWPLTFIFFLYSLGRAILFLDWKIFIIGLTLWAVSSAAQLALGILSD